MNDVGSRAALKKWLLLALVFAETFWWILVWLAIAIGIILMIW